jgi:hypothetical protein
MCMSERSVVYSGNGILTWINIRELCNVDSRSYIINRGVLLLRLRLLVWKKVSVTTQLSIF